MTSALGLDGSLSWLATISLATPQLVSRFKSGIAAFGNLPSWYVRLTVPVYPFGAGLNDLIPYGALTSVQALQCFEGMVAAFDDM